METGNVLKLAEGMSNFGVLILIAAIFLILSSGLMFACFKWFKTIIDSMIDSNRTGMEELLNETRQQNVSLAELTEALRPETALRIRNTTNTYFDLAIERVCRIIKRVREENHISDKDATKLKIHNLLQNIHGDRNSRWESYTYRGKHLNEYSNPEWVDWVQEVVEKEIYNEHPDNGRAYSNVTMVYGRIKLDMYERLNH